MPTSIILYQTVISNFISLRKTALDNAKDIRQDSRMEIAMRLALAPAPTFTDAAGNNEKARALSAGEHQGQRAVVNFEFKADRRECDQHPRRSHSNASE